MKVIAGGDFLAFIMVKDRLTNYCFQLLLFIVPLVFTLWTRDVFILVKFTFFQLILLLLFSFWLKESLNTGEIRILKSPMNFAWFVFIISIGLSIPFSLNKIEGLKSWGEFLSCGLFYILVLNCVRDESGLTRLLRAAVAGGLVVSLCGIFQYLGIDPLKSGMREPFSTLGNVNFVGQYLILILPFSFFLVWYSSRWIEKLFWCLTPLIILTCLILTRSKGAWLGCASAGIMVISLLTFLQYRHSHGSFRVVLIISIISLVIVGFLRWFLLSPGGEKFLLELSAFSDPDYSSNKFRILTWKGTWQIFIDNPVVGVGLNNFKLVYPAYRTLDAWQVTGRETEVFVAHNDYLQFSAETGIIGFAGFLFFLGTSLVIGFSLIRHNSKNDYWKYISLATLVAFIATLIHAFFDFNLQNPVPRIFLGFLTGILAIAYNKTFGLQSSYTFRFKKGKKLWTAIVILIFLISLLILRPMVAEILVVKAWRFNNQGRVNEAIRLIEKSFLLMPNDYEARYFAGIFYYDAGRLEEAIEQYRKSLLLHPNDPFTHYNLAVCYLAVRDNDEAKIELETSLHLNPLDPDAYLGISHVYMKRGNYDEAIDLLTRGLKFLPLDDRLHNNLGVSYELKGLIRDAEAEYLRALRINPENTSAKVNLERLHKSID